MMADVVLIAQILPQTFRKKLRMFIIKLIFVNSQQLLLGVLLFKLYSLNVNTLVSAHTK